MRKKVLEGIRNLMCIVRKMSSMGRSGKRSKMAEQCMQGWMHDECEPLLEEWEVWLTQKDEEERTAERLEQHKAWVENLFGSVQI